MSILNFLGLLFSPNSLKRDLIYKKKIITQIEIKNKVRFVKDNGISTHRIYFNENEFLNVYNVGQDTFDKINIGDKIYLQCSKFGKWVIELKWKNESIENTGYIK